MIPAVDDVLPEVSIGRDAAAAAHRVSEQLSRSLELAIARFNMDIRRIEVLMSITRALHKDRNVTK